MPIIYRTKIIQDFLVASSCIKLGIIVKRREPIMFANNGTYSKGIQLMRIHQITAEGIRATDGLVFSKNCPLLIRMFPSTFYFDCEATIELIKPNISEFFVYHIMYDIIKPRISTPW